MHELTGAAFQTLGEVWGEVHEQHDAPPALQAQLWRMAANICTGFALQHKGHDDNASAAFEWLALICDTRQQMAMAPHDVMKPAPLHLAVVQSLPRTH